MVSSLFELNLAEVSPLVFPVIDLGEVFANDTVADAAAVSRAEEEARMQQRVEEAREEAFERGLAAGEERRRQESETERSAVSVLCSSFAKERGRYFADVESEVVRLSLAIAARVLQREVAIDPALLQGVVRVALSKLADSKGAVLRMHSRDVAMWRAEMKHAAVEIVGDDALEIGELRLEAAGSLAELGVAAQLQEIERGFFDLMARRPA